MEGGQDHEDAQMTADDQEGSAKDENTVEVIMSLNGKPLLRDLALAEGEDICLDGKDDVAISWTRRSVHYRIHIASLDTISICISIRAKDAAKSRSHQRRLTQDLC